MPDTGLDGAERDGEAVYLEYASLLLLLVIAVVTAVLMLGSCVGRAVSKSGASLERADSAAAAPATSDSLRFHP